MPRREKRAKTIAIAIVGRPRKKSKIWALENSLLLLLQFWEKGQFDSIKIILHFGWTNNILAQCVMKTLYALTLEHCLINTSFNTKS